MTSLAHRFFSANAHGSAVGLLITLIFITGCASKGPPLPKYDWVDSQNALRILHDRAESIKTVSGTATIDLENAEGDSVRFDGAVAMAPPDRFRMRAWKFNQAVFDLTLTPDGLWILTPD